MKIYTKTGDDGTTGLLASGRVAKDSQRIEAYGTVDELNAVIGAARAAGMDTASDETLSRIQDDLFVVGSALADPNPVGPYHNAIQSEHVAWLESQIDELESELVPLTQFILPGGTMAAAMTHLARTVARRAERAVVHLAHQENEDVPDELLIYLNRLSDFLFVLARAVNHRAGKADIPWKGL